MPRPFEPDIVETPEAMPLIQRGHLLRPIWPGPCGDVRVWDDRTLGNDAIWCGVVIVDALLTVGARLEVL